MMHALVFPNSLSFSGHIHFSKTTLVEREEQKKREKKDRRKEKEEEDDIIQKVWIKYTLGLKHQVSIILAGAADLAL